MDPNRHPVGTPAGGRFASDRRAGVVVTALRRRLPAVALVILLVTVAAACDPDGTTHAPAPAPAPRSVPTDLDTFTTSSQPTATRGNDVVMRVMASAGKTKIGYASFPVAGSSATVDGTVSLYARQGGFNLRVHNTGPFSDATTHNDRPALGTQVGTLSSTTANTRHVISVRGVRVAGGRAHLAFTTTSPYELELLSSEGAAAAGQTANVPTLVVGPPAAPAPSPTEPAPSPTEPAPTPPPAWKLTFADEFNGTSVEAKKWHVYDQSNGDTVESPKASTCVRGDNVSVGGGKLVMRTRKANGGCAAGQAHSGAGMNTWGRFSQAGGRFVARGRWTHKGNYLWGGFWTAGLGGEGWTKDNPTEIDTWEYIGKDAEPNISRYKPAIHYNYTCEGTCGTQSLQQLDYDVTAWHTYAVEWDPTNPADPTTMQIRFYLDGRQIALFDKHGTWRVTPTGTKVLEIAGGWKNPAGAFPNPFGMDRPHRLILSAWVGAPGVSPATVAAGYNPPGGGANLEIDYVRVYSR